MPLTLQIVLMMALAYVIGGIPMGLLVAKAKGVDIRKAGSGNIGATNVARVIGPYFGVLVLLLDAIKGASTSLGTAWYLDTHGADFAAMGPATPDLVRLCVAIACVVGNTASIFLGFRGGKGVATALGVFLGIHPYLTWPVLISFGFWLLVVGRTKYVSLGSIAASATVPFSFLACAKYFRWDLSEHWPLLCLTVILAAVVAVRHRANIGRLKSGTESRIGGASPDTSSNPGE
ncbi:MAG TPA: glycerol-3-phosphate 1-O-acyltransferase PlsY [Phycisphaerae bacterium]|nr:glycerol-3-phosphate 1-O-acyltransferase PlsY [Phycisphaerae bacterium]HRW52935.1 glycerol-3-phosphate 1-O-acyltransferase PlsY [Phycisphaerae bacterium]